MNCPFCGKELQKGGIIAGGPVAWFPEREFNRDLLSKLGIYGHGKTLGKFVPIVNQIKIPNAYYCDTCGKVMGAFD